MSMKKKVMTRRDDRVEQDVQTDPITMIDESTQKPDFGGSSGCEKYDGGEPNWRAERAKVQRLRQGLPHFMKKASALMSVILEPPNPEPRQKPNPRP